MIDQQIIASIMPWIAHSFYFLAFLPQLFLNHKLKTTKGLSQWYMIGYLNGYAADLIYIYCLKLPLSYKIMVPLSTCAVIVLIAQRFFYDEFKSDNKDHHFMFFCLFNILVIFGIIFWAVKYPIIIGSLGGWLMAIIWTVYQLPQIMKIFHEKFVKGFSLSLVSLIAFGSCFEFVAALVLCLPAPTIFSGFRGVLVSLIFGIQFLAYNKRYFFTHS